MCQATLVQSNQVESSSSSWSFSQDAESGRLSQQLSWQTQDRSVSGQLSSNSGTFLSRRIGSAIMLTGLMLALCSLKPEQLSPLDKVLTPCSVLDIT